jgi:hypothetical protein
MPKIKISDLKKSLAECHIDSSDDKLKFLLDVKDPSYFLQRTMEAIHECQQGIDIYDNSRLAVQLMNLFRVYHRNEEAEASIAFGDELHESPTVVPTRL